MHIYSKDRRDNLHVAYRRKNFNWKEAFMELQAVVDRLESRLNEQSEIAKPKHLTINTSHTSYFIPLSEILYCEADGNYTKIYVLNNTPILIAKTLKKVEEMIDSSLFIRCHQTYLINQKHVMGYKNQKGMHVILCNETMVPVSRRNYKEIKRILNA